MAHDCRGRELYGRHRFGGTVEDGVEEQLERRAGLAAQRDPAAHGDRRASADLEGEDVRALVQELVAERRAWAKSRAYGRGSFRSATVNRIMKASRFEPPP